MKLVLSGHGQPSSGIAAVLRLTATDILSGPVCSGCGILTSACHKLPAVLALFLQGRQPSYPGWAQQLAVRGLGFPAQDV